MPIFLITSQKGRIYQYKTKKQNIVRGCPDIYLEEYTIEQNEQFCYLGRRIALAKKDINVRKFLTIKFLLYTIFCNNYYPFSLKIISSNDTSNVSLYYN